MKTRNDFVSNSSSCSFIISDAVQFKYALLKLESTGYELTSITIRAECSIENKKFFEEQELASNMYSDTYDNICRFSIELSGILSLDDDDLKRIGKVELECDHFDTSSMFMLSVLKKALENMGVPVDSSCSDHPLLLEDDDNYDGNKFLKNICFEAFKQ